ncbi:hypothetical protein GDO86_002767 [Hymenochirus boettgeri]|uniref:Fibronectin type-III domain-containing protein n=1 Tax=Hymenochirus boettgeri TaxID=247094 RepID=A0A8T2K6H5_9PIPI|nr:hypothetical protein GDO86_002767 [Hymenochirus boettgeri]KAG8450241.1 hypothetical protein GDO86_002767 [Hymenochirus boettgeri]
MKSLTILLQLCLPSMLVLSLKPPVNVQILSVNFQHTLTWEEPNNISPVYYRVQYKNYGRPWSDVSECVNITAQSCDLTGYFTELMGLYYAQVFSFTHNGTSKPKSSSRLSPLSDTDLGPPLVDLSAFGCNGTINMQPPVSHLKTYSSILHDDVYPLIIYEIWMWQKNQKLFEHTKICGNENCTYVMSNLLPSHNYCVSVYVSASLNTRGKKIPSAMKCVTTQSSCDGAAASSSTTVAVICGVLFLLIILCGLFTLDRAGYIFMGPNFFPKFLKSLPRSVSMSENKELICPEQVLSIEAINSHEKVDCIESDEDTYGQGYSTRKRILGSAHTESVTGDSSSAHPPASSESSGQDFRSSAEEEIVKDHPSDVIDESASNLSLPDQTEASPPCLFLNNADFFNVNLNSVSVGNPEDLWTDFKKVYSKDQPVSSNCTLPEDSPDQGGHKHLTNILTVDSCKGAVSEEWNVEELPTSDDNDSSEPEEHFASEYIRR